MAVKHFFCFVYDSKFSLGYDCHFVFSKHIPAALKFRVAAIARTVPRISDRPVPKQATFVPRVFALQHVAHED